jgi:PAS domain S-box-containing protein
MDRSTSASPWGIRHRITVLFLAVACTILIPTFLVTYRWSQVSYQRLQESTLRQGYDAWLYFVDTKRSILERTVHLAGSHVAGHAVSLEQDRSMVPVLVDLKKNLSLDMVVLVDAEGRRVAGDMDVNLFDGARAGDEKGFLRLWRDQAVTGFWEGGSDQTWLLAGAPLSTADDLEGRRFLMIGYKVDAAFSAEFKRWFGIGVQFISRSSLAINASETPAPGTRERAWKDLVYSQKPYLVLSSDENAPESKAENSLVFLIRDLRGEAIALGIMRAAPRGLPGFRHFLFIAYWVVLVALSSFLVLAGRFFVGQITEPLVRLREAIRSIETSGDLSGRLPVPQEEEMGALTREFNAMLDKLDRTNGELKATGEKLSILYTDLLEQKKFMSEIFSAASSLVLLLLPDGRVKFVNEASETILGFRPEEVIGCNWFDNFLSLRARTDARHIFDEILRGNIEPYRRVESEILRKDGSESSILWSNSLFKDASGQVTSVLAIGTDISVAKKVEGELRRKITELERFYRVTMDRERVIMQLKKEITELRKRCA